MRSRPAQGYLLVVGSFLLMGLIGVLVEWATAPESEPAIASLEPAP